MKTEFGLFITKIVKDLQEKGVNITISEKQDEEWNILKIYFDTSVPNFFSKYFGPLAYDILISAIYEKFGTEHHYIIKDNMYISSEYKKEKKPNIVGKEVEYIRTYITFNVIKLGE